MSYITGNAVQKRFGNLAPAYTFGPTPPPAFDAGGVVFANSSRLSNPAFAFADSPLLTVSLWVFSAVQQSARSIWLNDSNGNQVPSLKFFNNGAGLGYNCTGNNATFTDPFAVSNTVAGALSTWNHLLISINLNNTTGPIKSAGFVLNGVDVTNQSAQNATVYNMAFNGKVLSLGYLFLNMVGALSEFWYAPGVSLLDASGVIPQSEIDKFYNPLNGKPMNLGADGSAPTGSPPAIYLHADLGSEVATFSVNSANGVALTATGTALAASPTWPSQ